MASMCLNAVRFFENGGRFFLMGTIIRKYGIIMAKGYILFESKNKLIHETQKRRAKNN